MSDALLQMIVGQNINMADKSQLKRKGKHRRVCTEGSIRHPSNLKQTPVPTMNQNIQASDATAEDIHKQRVVQLKAKRLKLKREMRKLHVNMTKSQALLDQQAQPKSIIKFIKPSNMDFNGFKANGLGSDGKGILEALSFIKKKTEKKSRALNINDRLNLLDEKQQLLQSNFTMESHPQLQAYHDLPNTYVQIQDQSNANMRSISVQKGIHRNIQSTSNLINLHHSTHSYYKKRTKQPHLLPIITKMLPNTFEKSENQKVDIQINQATQSLFMNTKQNVMSQSPFLQAEQEEQIDHKKSRAQININFEQGLDVSLTQHNNSQQISDRLLEYRYNINPSIQHINKLGLHQTIDARTIDPLQKLQWAENMIFHKQSKSKSNSKNLLPQHNRSSGKSATESKIGNGINNMCLEDVQSVDTLKNNDQKSSTSYSKTSKLNVGFQNFQMMRDILPMKLSFLPQQISKNSAIMQQNEIKLQKNRRTLLQQFVNSSDLKEDSLQLSKSYYFPKQNNQSQFNLKEVNNKTSTVVNDSSLSLHLSNLGSPEANIKYFDFKPRTIQVVNNQQRSPELKTADNFKINKIIKSTFQPLGHQNIDQSPEAHKRTFTNIPKSQQTSNRYKQQSVKSIQYPKYQHRNVNLQSQATQKLISQISHPSSKPARSDGKIRKSADLKLYQLLQKPKSSQKKQQQSIIQIPTVQSNEDNEIEKSINYSSIEPSDLELDDQKQDK
ncbi:UNKNOWN [Stylonychia lemnae]|uniref:Uncharacterized protein n=1 Tax=Stylonychia lemnae TaxID=5949 RepID=A0A078ALA3_STYLE|nr:UNKNOWN [Stylonychia lemnae]|eukprot:CDW82192.1 UNKNOWN [Stylonychia lemnae]